MILEFPEHAVTHHLFLSPPRRLKSFPLYQSTLPLSHIFLSLSQSPKSKDPFLLSDSTHSKALILLLLQPSKNAAAVLHGGFLGGSFDPLCSSNQKLEPLCGNHGIYCKRIKNIHHQSLSSPQGSLVQDLQLSSMLQQHKVDLISRLEFN